MSERANYIRGLRTLAQLLEDNPDLSLPHDGPSKGHEQSIFINGPSSIAQALLFIEAMNEPPTMALKRQSPTLTWLDITGRIEGLHVQLSLRAQEVCELIDPYRASDGSVREWAIPAELRDATGGDL